jgi:hypothetical protein
VTHADGLDRNDPFQMDTDEEVAEKVRTYTDANGLDTYFELLNCGAQLAKDRHYALANKSLFPKLSEEQEKYLKGGKKDGETSNRFWGLPKYLKRGKKDGKRYGEESARFWGQSKYLKGSLLSACLAGIIH